MVRVATDILTGLNQKRWGVVKVVLLKDGVNTFYRGCVIFPSVIEGYLIQAGRTADRASSRVFLAAAAGEATVSLGRSYEGLGGCK
jgi:hypothetical protein